MCIICTKLKMIKLRKPENQVNLLWNYGFFMYKLAAQLHLNNKIFFMLFILINKSY